MKRLEPGVFSALAPGHVKRARRDVAGGRPIHAVPAEVASSLHASRHASARSLSDGVADTDLLADFADFVAGGEALAGGELAPPDPVFRERLRRQLWRTHVVMTRSFGGSDTH